jgi:transposase-like protein
MTKETSSLAPEKAFCPNPDCAARGRVAEGNIGIHSEKERHYICHLCHKTFSATKGTVYYRRHKAVDVMTCVVTLLAHGCPIQAVVVAFALDERTVRDWLDASGAHCRAVHEQLVERPRPLGQVQADALRVKALGSILWGGMALQVQTRLWLGIEVSERRDRDLIARLIARVKRAARALGGPLLFCTDGLASYPTQIKAVFREQEPRTEKGRCRLVAWPRILIAQVVKEYVGKCVNGIQRRIVQGTPETIAAVIKERQGAGGINTAFIERLNGTFRSCLSSLARRTRALGRKAEHLTAGAFLVGTGYNFCTEHERLRLPGLVGGHQWLERPLAMASGLTDHCWSVKELLSYRVPPPRWQPPKKRGRVSAAMKEVIKRWG